MTRGFIFANNFFNISRGFNFANWLLNLSFINVLYILVFPWFVFQLVVSESQNSYPNFPIFQIALFGQFVIFNLWKFPWNWIAFSQNSFVISPGLLYHLIRRDNRWLVNETFMSNPFVSSKKLFSGLKITNCGYKRLNSRLNA